MYLRKKIGVLLTILVGSHFSLSQAVCVTDSVKVANVKGKIMAHLVQGDSPLEGITVKLRLVDNPKVVIRKTVTNSDGEFNLGRLPKGRYRLNTIYRSLKDFYLDLVVVPHLKTTSKKELRIWLGADFAKPCAGSYAELIESKK